MTENDIYKLLNLIAILVYGVIWKVVLVEAGGVEPPSANGPPLVLHV